MQRAFLGRPEIARQSTVIHAGMRALVVAAVAGVVVLLASDVLLPLKPFIITALLSWRVYAALAAAAVFKMLVGFVAVSWERF